MQLNPMGYYIELNPAWDSFMGFPLWARVSWRQEQVDIINRGYSSAKCFLLVDPRLFGDDACCAYLDYVVTTQVFKLKVKQQK